MVKDTALRALARIKSFRDYWKDNEPERESFRDVLDNGEDAFKSEVQILDADGNVVPLTILNFYVRLRGRIESKCFDESPELSCPREATGSEEHADAISRLASRITEEARLQYESRDGIASVMTEGGYGIVYGMPNLPDAADVNERAKGTAQILEETVAAIQAAASAAGFVGQPGMKGTGLGIASVGSQPPPSEMPVPTQGQDHATIAQVLMETATDPINVLANTPEVTQALIDMAAAHLKAQEDEERSTRYWRYDENVIFTERVEIGSHLAWDLTYGDPKRGSWMAYAIELSLDEAQSHPAFKSSLRKRLVVTVPDDKEFHKVSVEGETEEENKAENGTVKIWVYFDKKRRVRHYVPESLSEGDIEFLEVDDKNPYLKEDGSPLLPWFWPINVFTYRKRSKRGPHRSLPTPYMRSGWSQQVESIKYDTAIREGVCAAMQDKYLVHSEVSDDEMQSLTNGRLHVVVKRPAGLERGEEALKSIDFKPPLREVFEERAQQKQRFCEAANYPYTEFAGMPLANTTLGQTEIATSSGSEAMSDLERMLECFYAEVVQGLLIIASAKMPAEVAANYMGVEMEKVWDGWRQSVRRGDMVRATFAPTTREMNPARAKLLMDVVGVGLTLMDPITRFPMADPETLFRLFSEACKNLGVGSMKKFVPTPEQAMALMAFRQQEQQNSQKPNGGGGEKNGKGQGGQRGAPPGGKERREHGPTDRAHEESAARRV